MLATEQDISGMRVAGKAAADLLNLLSSHIKPGISTGELNRIAAEWTADIGGVSAPYNYAANGHQPFPAHICTSVNEIACHGMPSNDVILVDGYIVNIDVTPIINGYHGDVSKTFAVGRCSREALELIAATEKCLCAGIDAARAGEYIGTIGYAVSKTANDLGYSIVREFSGHGIGRKFHTQPYVPHYGIPNTGIKLSAGMIFTIEPILCKGNPTIFFRNDWEAIIASGNISAQAEHTILICSDKTEILTYEPSRKSIREG